MNFGYNLTLIWAAYKLIKTEKKNIFIWFSISIALLITTHSLMTLIFAPVAVLWVIYWIFIERNGDLF